MTTVLIVDDHEIVLKGIENAITRDGEYELLGKAYTGKEGVKLACELNPNIVIMDIALPDLDGVSATRQILSRCPSTDVIALSGYTTPDVVIDMFQAGARGYLAKSHGGEELLRALRIVRNGNAYFDPGISNTILDSLLDSLALLEEAQLMEPNPQERQLLDLVSKGKRISEIAADMGMCKKTVYSIRRRLMKKLSIDSTLGLARYALQNQWKSDSVFK